MLRLIVNADDLGLTSGVNRAIFQAHRAGIVSSATLMANGPAFDDAVAVVLASPEYKTHKLGTGCHIVLIDGVPVSPPQQIRSLLEAGAQPNFRSKLSKFALAAMLGRISVDDVEREAMAQIRKIQSAGIMVSHIDCHKHAHMFPSVLEGVLRAAKACGVAGIRNPFEPPFARASSLGASKIRSVETATLNRLYSQGFLKRVREFGLQTTNGSLGVAVTGTLDLDAFVALISNAPKDGTYEFVCHPGYNDAALASAGTRLLQSREIELDLLCSEKARGVLHSSNVRLVNFCDLVPTRESNSTAVHPMP